MSCRGQRFAVGPWGGCDANCTCGVTCTAATLTKAQRRSVQACDVGAPRCTLYSDAPAAERLCAAAPCRPCNAAGSQVHGSICSAAGTAVDSASGLLACAIGASGAPVCECRRGWRGARCHIRSAQGLLDVAGAACEGALLPAAVSRCTTCIAAGHVQVRALWHMLMCGIGPCTPVLGRD